MSADPGTIGGKYSHEFHIVSEVGEDTIYFCQSCKNGYSEEFMAKNTTKTECKKCDSCGGDLVTKSSIEVGHAFLLGTRYTEPFKCFYKTKTNENEYVYDHHFSEYLNELLFSPQIVANGLLWSWRNTNIVGLP